ncbi:MAG: thiol peroxidase [Candidatus Omnitrophota bacterium]|jgi:thiol peroxidase
MTRSVRFKGDPLTLVGRGLKINDPAADFRVVSPDLKEINLKDFAGKIKLITSFPSLDTPVCDLQVKEFNKRAAGLAKEIAVIAVSKDLPFAQKRFCDSFDIRNVTLASDYKFSSFGINYGLLIKELNLLARAVVIVDKNDRVRYVQIVGELTSPPDYQDALKALEEVIKNPLSSLGEEIPAKCKPCAEGTPPLPKERIEELLAQYRGWALVEEKKLVKEFRFKDFLEAKYFLNLIALVAEEQGHHPTLTIIYNKLKVTLTTHAAGGLTDNDFIMARIIDEVGGVT